MFELFGCFALRETKDVTANKTARPIKTIVHTGHITDGEGRLISSYWRDYVCHGSMQVYLERLAYEVEQAGKCSRLRMSQLFPDAIIITAEELNVS